MSIYYVVDIGDQFVLYSGSLENCKQFMDENYGGLQILKYSELTDQMILNDARVTMDPFEIEKQSFHCLSKRIQLISTNDEYTKLQYGDLGTIDYIDDTGTVFVTWDNGSKLGLIPGVDRWKIIHD